ncbi:MAPEG family protein [Arenimonas sp.]|uniref:MAPEG family protein n=1 Tax=Arenimonas sp. TaxID=1872635 RepID=UPI0039E448DF
MHLHAALITTLAVLLNILAIYFVGRARGKYQIKAPATAGHPDFERVFRAHQNTLEQTVLFLPVLWLASSYANETTAMGLGYAWLVGRTWYLFGYMQEAGKRSMGFLIGALAAVGLLGMAMVGIVMRMLG